MSTLSHGVNGEKVLAAIRKAGKPLSIEQLKRATGLSAEKVRSAIGNMKSGAGGIVSKRTPSGVVYDLYRPNSRTFDPRDRRAGPIVYPGYVYGATRLSW